VDIPDDLLQPTEEPSGKLEALREINSVLKDQLEVADRELEARRREIQELHTYCYNKPRLHCPSRWVPGAAGGGGASGNGVNHTVCLVSERFLFET
jgi:hypothetical protein